MRKGESEVSGPDRDIPNCTNRLEEVLLHLPQLRQVFSGRPKKDSELARKPGEAGRRWREMKRGRRFEDRGDGIMEKMKTIME